MCACVRVRERALDVQGDSFHFENHTPPLVWFEMRQRERGREIQDMIGNDNNQNVGKFEI